MSDSERILVPLDVYPVPTLNPSPTYSRKNGKKKWVEVITIDDDPAEDISDDEEELVVTPEWIQKELDELTKLASIPEIAKEYLSLPQPPPQKRVHPVIVVPKHPQQQPQQIVIDLTIDDDDDDDDAEKKKVSDVLDDDYWDELLADPFKPKTPEIIEEKLVIPALPFNHQFARKSWRYRRHHRYNKFHQRRSYHPRYYKYLF